ncbi:PREDICTED: uncharacterized protein LOC104602882 [Nelumbo nucifera]|uniref:Uncharacterized protein LOC104602882 n=2 Tax=Nelumbo nucifera TaxID=4432 RepID=A0A1U8AQ43_NELNU|nr:PREDICTED: uncharacterized protein LOC104602882 [Nelumbo nucifera]DAD20009.1 TPA_asm: hypothetical protein HUJ06_021472 [Nelumbo nucifera]
MKSFDMGYQHSHRDSLAELSTTSQSECGISGTEVDWPFGKVEGVDQDDLRQTAYEIFFTACRSSPGFGGKSPLTYYNTSTHENGDVGVGGVGGGVGAETRANWSNLMGTSRIKRALGLRSAKRVWQRRNGGSNQFSPRSMGSPRSCTGFGSSSHAYFNTTPPLRMKRPLTSAEIMRQQMKVSEQSDNRLRKTLMRTLVGQMGRRSETIILPLELLRHLKPSEFNDAHEYHLWQKRQFKILEAGLLIHPLIPLDLSNTYAVQLQDIIRESETKPLDTGKNSEIMRTLYSSVVSLSMRGANASPAGACHWADGYPINIHLYVALLHSIFDLRDETVVLDEVDELLELMKKTWSTLGINKSIHDVCFAWTLFQQYLTTAQTEVDLLSAAVTMLAEVANDAQRDHGDVIYMKILSAALSSMHVWSEKKLLDYHETFQKVTMGVMENLLPLAQSVTKILEEDVGILSAMAPEKADTFLGSTEDKVDYYIRSSLRNAFAKMVENGNIVDNMTAGVEDTTEAFLQLAKQTEDLAMTEKKTFSPILKKWHPFAAAIAAVTLHECYGTVLKQYLSGVSTLTNEAIIVLQRAGKLEKFLVPMIVENSDDCDGGKTIAKEMVPYEVDSIILSLLKSWIDDRLKSGRELLERAKETETWNPMSKTEPYAHSAVDLIKLAMQTVDDFFKIPVGISNDMVQDLSNGLELVFQDYITFVATCGSKQSYIPSLPPLTRCSRSSTFHKFLMKAASCKYGAEFSEQGRFPNSQNPRPSTSRGTQRLYIRLNTLHYLLTHIHSLDKTIFLSPRPAMSSPHTRVASVRRNVSTTPAYFDLARSSIQTATQHVSEVAAYRLIFLDSSSVFYESLYVGGAENSRIRPALRILKQNLTLLSAILIDRAQSLAIKEVMRASFEAYLMVLLAGGNARVFSKSDHEMIEEDFESLKRVFTSGEGLVVEDVVDREAETVEGVVALMGQSTEQLVEDFSIIACEASGMGVVRSGKKLPMPPTTGRWNRADPNTILRVLCHRNDGIANRFLKRTFQLAKRR